MTVSPSFSNSFSFECPVDASDLSVSFISLIFYYMSDTVGQDLLKGAGISIPGVGSI